ncbi:HK97 family phage prohead protease [Priestia aryabhattai]|uniref:HK97 family phage prohead protease n=1 Tax=Priestia aryabhattai TaxID=412384 RepID=UPI002E1A5386|nr:HK97 family phage prohead protease [Priestia aryabhattai]MED3946582.1 HK97 family phage prohead protease [Priestia aryabhattai]
MTLNKFELRFNDDINMQTTNDGLLVSGYVNKTNQWSQTLGQRKKFVERILPGAFRKALQNGNEIRFLAEHDKDKVLATTRNGSLTLREDDEGLYMEATISPTSYGRDYHTLIHDGVIQNMSFGMAVLKDSWKKMSDGLYERSISDLALYEVSAVKDPAYAQSTIAARSIEVIEDVEITEEKAEKRELTLQEQLDVKKSNLESREKMLSLFGRDLEIEESIEALEGEIRKMESTINKQTTATTADNLERQEERMMTPVGTFDSDLVKTNLIREKAKKMKGKYSLVGRTNVEIQKEGKLEVVLQDAENYDKNLFVGDSDNVILDDYTGTKILIDTQRIGTGVEASKTLLEKSNRVAQEEVIENTAIYRIHDGLNRSMLKGEGNMESLNADASVSSITSTVEINKISWVDVTTLIGKMNQTYREGAEFIMHTNVLNKILINADFKDHIEFDMDAVSGEKMYHLLGFPIVVNDYADENRIILSNLKAGYKTLFSENLKSVTQDIYGNQINKQYRSFDLQPTSNTNKAYKGTVVYVMDVFAGGKVINKDCFARLDVKTA